MEQELLVEKQKLKEKMSTFKKQQSEQLELNKKLREEQVKKDFELDNQPPSGQDLMYALYQDKRHASYDKRIKQDKIMEVMRDQILYGDSMKRIMNEEKVLQKYIKDKEMSDTFKDE